MIEPVPVRVRMASPAKLNLGLEVIGPRSDGFHDIATIFLAIDLQDTLQLAPSDAIEACGARANVADADNLALRALRLLRQSTQAPRGARLQLTKKIPLASGLGGASSNAATALLAGCELWRLSVTEERLHDMARHLGSDVPFFLRGGCALGLGRGDSLQALPVPGDLWFTIVVPTVAIPQKTAKMFANLIPKDFSDGQSMHAQATRIAAGQPFDPRLLSNAFSRPLYELKPELAALPALMQKAGAEAVALSGAGPTHFAPFSNRTEANVAAVRLRDDLGASARVYVARPAAERSVFPQPL